DQVEDLVAVRRPEPTGELQHAAGVFHMNLPAAGAGYRRPLVLQRDPGDQRRVEGPVLPVVDRAAFGAAGPLRIVFVRTVRIVEVLHVAALWSDTLGWIVWHHHSSCGRSRARRERRSN